MNSNLKENVELNNQIRKTKTQISISSNTVFFMINKNKAS